VKTGYTEHARGTPATLELAVVSSSRSTNQHYPGYLIRRAQQVASSIFFSRLRPFGLTPIQHTILRVLQEHGSIDQRSLATLAGLDTSTTTDVLVRLVEKKLVSRTAGTLDRRTRVVRLSKRGERLLAKVQPHIVAGQQELLRPLSATRRRDFIEALLDLIEAHDASDADGRRRPWRRFR
jgi:DNA-binding MarR family transcriptional regulator